MPANKALWVSPTLPLISFLPSLCSLFKWPIMASIAELRLTQGLVSTKRISTAELPTWPWPRSPLSTNTHWYRWPVHCATWSSVGASVLLSCGVPRKLAMPYYYIAPRQTAYGDFAAQLILLMHLPLGNTTRLWGMEAVYFVLIPSLLTNNTLRVLFTSSCCRLYKCTEYLF